jgi:predicted small metal-binding protein
MSPSPAARSHSASAEIIVRHPSMKQFYCGAIMHDCETRMIAPTEDDLLRSVDTHARVDHGMTDIPESMLDEVRQNIHDVEPADHHD